MDAALRTALRDLLLSLADDELILGQRASEWCGHAPILEEDIAFANLALDELGHAGVWYALAAELEGEDPESYPDRMIYLRDANEFRCAQLVELPNGDFAFSMLRQFLMDASEKARLEALLESRYAPMAEAAQKILTEERYHLRHTQAWVRRLSLGTEESHARMQAALEACWPYVAQLFALPSAAGRLTSAGYVRDPAETQAAWMAESLHFVQDCTLAIPAEAPLALARGEHSPHLRALLAEMQSLARQAPGARW